ncbi:MAG TPA: cupin domain-containing protein [Anaerohalosphaeraceae bacterium]|jgi:mannose-6-phosphate isomerase-like protein (cupin superfamily)|nr:cupin domain-containing protein [Anaerohalosphaeraceae bacterium]
MELKPVVMELVDSSEYQPLLRGAPQTRGMRSGRVHLDPGQSCGQHTTGDHEEQLVFLTGVGTAYCGSCQKSMEVGVGKILYFPPQTQHDIRNTGTQPLVYIYCVSPVEKESHEKCA